MWMNVRFRGSAGINSLARRCSRASERCGHARRPITNGQPGQLSSARRRLPGASSRLSVEGSRAFNTRSTDIA